MNASLTQVSLGLCVVFLAITAHAADITVQGSSAGVAILKETAMQYEKTRAKALQAAPAAKPAATQPDPTRIHVAIAGSGASLARFCRGEIEIAQAARPMAPEELTACARAETLFIELPLAFDAVTVVVNPRNDFIQSLGKEDLQRLWAASSEGKLLHWKQLNDAYPDTPIKLYGPDAQFESHALFFDAVLGPNTAPRRDVTVSVDDATLVQAVARDTNALSFVSHATYLEARSRLKAVAIAEDGKAVVPSAQSIAEGRYRLLSRPLFLYVSVKALARPEVREFAAYAVTHAGRFAQAAKSLPLSEAAYRLAGARLAGQRTGSVWAGTQPIGLTLTELDKKYAAVP
jgi:phosphate transport system substrate-binding protein